MALQIELMVFELLITVLFIIAQYKIILKWKDSRNKMFIAISIYIWTVITNSLLRLFSYLFNIDLEVYIIGYIKIGIILAHILFIVQFEFMLYLQNRKRYYTLPIISTFYLLVGQYLIPSALPFIIYATILTYPPAYLLLRDGKRNRNGVAIGMGLFYLFWGIGYIVQAGLLLQIMKFIAAIAFFLGTIGFYEKYIFPNQEDEEKIMGTWISKLVIKE